MMLLGLFLQQLQKPQTDDERFAGCSYQKSAETRATKFWPHMVRS
jgi:hypothetical protein